MIFLKRLTPYLSTILIFLFLEFSLKFYKLWAWWFIFIFIFISLTILFLNNFQFNKDSLGFMITPLFLVWSCLLFIFFQDKIIISQFIILLTTFTCWLFIRDVTIFFYKPSAYITYSLENVAAYANLLALFLFTCSLFSFYILSVLPLFLAIILACLITYFLSWQILWINKISSLRFKYLPLFFGFMAGELFWVLHFWPTSFFINSFIFLIIYYVLISFVKLHHLERLDKKNTLTYLLTSSLILFIILATANWT